MRKSTQWKNHERDCRVPLLPCLGIPQRSLCFPLQWRTTDSKVVVDTAFLGRRRPLWDVNPSQHSGDNRCGYSGFLLGSICGAGKRGVMVIPHCQRPHRRRRRRVRTLLQEALVPATRVRLLFESMLGPDTSIEQMQLSLQSPYFLSSEIRKAFNTFPLWRFNASGMSNGTPCEPK